MLTNIVGSLPYNIKYFEAAIVNEQYRLANYEKLRSSGALVVLIL